jgi:hypothetical protein
MDSGAPRPAARGGPVESSSRCSTIFFAVPRKERLRAAAARSEPADDAPKRPERLGGVLEYVEQFEAEQKAKRQRQNRRAAFRREVAALGLGRSSRDNRTRITAAARRPSVLEPSAPNP